MYFKNNLKTSNPTLRPFLTGSNELVTFAPYHIWPYKALEDDLNRAGIYPNPNYWDRPFSTETGEKSWKLLDPIEFFYFAIPFDLDQEKSQKKFIFQPPKEYANAVLEKEQVHKHWKAKIKVHQI